MQACSVVLMAVFSGGMLFAQVAPGGAKPVPPNAPSGDPSRNLSGMPQVLPTTISGKVTMEDGSVPPAQVILQRFCADGTTLAEAATDLKGRFSADITSHYHPTEAIVHGRASELNPLAGCQLRAVLGGYTSDVLELGRFQLATSNDVGKIVLHKGGGVAGASVSETTQSAPKEARKNYDKARELLAKGKTDEAQKSLEKAVAGYPQFAAAWNELGDMYFKKGALADARNAYKSAIGADSLFIPPVQGLALVAFREDKWDEVLQLTSEVIRMDAQDFPGAFFLNGIAKYRQRDFDAAEKSTRQAIQLDSLHQYPQAQYQLGLILMMKGNFPGASEQFSGYLAANPNGDDAAGARAQLSAMEERMKIGKK